MRTSKCKSCGAPIIWIRTQNGKSMPCNAEPVYYAEGSGDKVITSKGEIIPCIIVSEIELADGAGYIPHWASCISPDKFRRNKK